MQSGQTLVGRPCNTSRLWRTALLLAGALIAAGCASKPIDYQVRASGDRVINRDEGGNPLSVVVRLYQLTDAKAFSRLTLEDVSNGRSDAELFGGEFVARSEIVVVPGQRAASPAQLDAQARYVGVVAMFRQPDPDHWRYLIPAERIRSNSSGIAATLGNLFADPAKDRSGLVFAVRDCSLAIVIPEPELLPAQRPQPGGTCPAASAGTPTGSPAPPRQRQAAKPTRRPRTGQALVGSE